MENKQSGHLIKQITCLGCLVFCALIVPVAQKRIRNNGIESIIGGYNRQARQSGSYPHSNDNNLLRGNDSSSLHMPAHTKTCNKGYYLNVTSQQCYLCPENTFNPEDNHTDVDCIECKADTYSHEIQIRPANGTHSPEFGCEARYFIEGSTHAKPKCPNVHCANCENCSVIGQFEGQQCRKESNAVCCKEKDMAVVGGMCTRRETTNATTAAINATSTPLNTTCGRNQYLDNSNDTCQPCPLHTYMNKDNHTDNVCFNCSEVTGTDKPDGCPDDNDNVRKDVDVGLVVGLCIGGLVVLIILIICLICLYRHGQCTAIIECFRRSQGTHGHEPERDVPAHLVRTYRFTPNGSMTLN